MTPILPHEIWRHIAKYVPTDCYQNILSVNPPLFDFVMDERYRHVRLYDWIGKTIKLLDRLQDTNLAGRVHFLSIDVTGGRFYWDNMFQGNPPSTGETGWLIHPMAIDIKRAICEAVGNMSRLTEYIVLCSPSEVTHRRVVPDVLPEFPAFSPQFRQNLQKLDLSLPMSKLVALNLNAVDFPRLQTFALTTMEGGYVLDQIDPEVEKTASSLIAVLAPFLCSHQSNLKFFSISTKVDLDDSPFFDLLGVFPHLISVSLCFGLRHKDNSLESPITRFVNRHAETLRSLAFKPRTFTSLERIWTMFSKMGLPHLQELTVGLRPYQTCIATLERCIRPFTNTLTTIDLTQECLSFENLQIVSGLFNQAPHVLKTISLMLQFLSPQVMDLLADRLQGLQDLTILFDSITDDAGVLDGTNGHTEDRFCREMEERSYPNWHLRNVALSLQFCCGKTCSWRAMKVLAKVLPSLRSFDGRGDLSVSEKWGDTDVYAAKEDMCGYISCFDFD